MNKENFALTYFNSGSLFLGAVYSLIFTTSGTDAILSSLLGTIIGILIIYLNYKLKLNDHNNILSFILSSIFIIFGIIIIETFVNSFFLTETPKLVIILPTILLALYNANNSVTEIKRNAFICLIISFIIHISIEISLISYINLNNLLPLFQSSKMQIIKSALIYGVLSGSPNIMIPRYNVKKHIKDYTIVAFLGVLIEVFIISCLTINVTKMYSFPEYMILKRIKLFEFIENIENVLTTIWYLAMFYMMTFNFKNIKKIVKKDKIYYLYIFFLTLLCTFIISKNYFQVLYIYHYGFYIILIIVILMIIKKIIKSNEKYK